MKIRKAPAPAPAPTPVKIEVREEYWTQKNGQRIAVGDMDETHVRNTLRMILKHARIRRERRELDERLDDILADEIWRAGKDW